MEPGSRNWMMAACVRIMEFFYGRPYLLYTMFYSPEVPALGRKEGLVGKKIVHNRFKITRMMMLLF